MWHQCGCVDVIILHSSWRCCGCEALHRRNMVQHQVGAHNTSHKICIRFGCVLFGCDYSISSCGFTWYPGSRFNIKTSSYQYRHSHYKDETVVDILLLTRRRLYTETGPGTRRVRPQARQAKELVWWHPNHSGWTPFYFMYDPKCSTTFPWCTINAPAAFAWCTINVPAAFAWCTNRFVHKVEFSYIGWNGVHPLCK